MSVRSSFLARLAYVCTIMGPCPFCVLLVISHPCDQRLSSMVWLSTTTCTPSLPRRRLRPPLLYPSAARDFPSWQSRRTFTRFSRSSQKNTCGRSKDASTIVCPTGAHYERCPWLCYGSGAAPRRPRRTMRNTKCIQTCLQNPTTTFCTLTLNFFLLQTLPHTRMLYASIYYLLPTPAPHEMDGSRTLHPYLPLAVCFVIV